MKKFIYERCIVYEIYVNKNKIYKNILFNRNISKININIFRFYRNTKGLLFIIRLPFFYFLKTRKMIHIGTNNNYFIFNMWGERKC
jgi:hypothetical protein